MKKLLLATALVALVTSPCLAGSPWCAAKNTAKIFDVPDETIGKVVRTITKQEGDNLMMPIGEIDSVLKGWHYVATYKQLDPTRPGLLESDVGGYVKADSVHCQIGQLK